MTNVENDTSEKLEKRMKIAARIVALYGENYLPIFNRLHAELIKEEENKRGKALALEIALAYGAGK